MKLIIITYNIFLTEIVTKLWNDFSLKLLGEAARYSKIFKESFGILNSDDNNQTGMIPRLLQDF